MRISKEQSDQVPHKYAETNNSSEYHFWGSKNLSMANKLDLNRFRNIGLFLGDLYSENLLGLCKLDIEDRINFYNEAKHSENPVIRDSAISRLLNLYYKIFTTTRQLKSE
jgi:hypothetical protein